MKVEEVTAFEYTCTPMFRESFPIRSCVMTIYARNRAEADELFYRHNHQFFDQDINVSVREFGGGYRQVVETTPKTT